MKIVFFFILSSFLYKASIASEKLKIVTLAPNLTEIVYELGLGSFLVGNTTWCDYPEEAKYVNKVADYKNIDFERILFSGANYILVTEGRSIAKLNFLKTWMKFKIIEFNPQNPHDIPKMLRSLAQEFAFTKIGRSLGVLKKGEMIALHIEKELLKLAQKKDTRKSFLLVLQFNPLYSVSENTWLGGLFLLSKLKNIVGKSSAQYPILQKDFLLKNKPDLILVPLMKGKNLEEGFIFQKKKINMIFGENSKDILVKSIPQDVLFRPGPRIVEGIRFIGKL